MTPLVLRNDVIESETAVYGPSPTWLVDRNARTGVVGWRVESGVQPALLEGPLLIGVEQSARSAELVAYRLSDGGQAWRTTLPEDVLIAPDKIGGEMVVQPQTVIPSCN
jgi:outer membrane protein assembly factor BamB